ncbi:oocyte zinc finger protein XlCOF6-like isoform X2 [Chelonus insularis]|uniref:oocyte zinc finger protein XlCOF6-like isoform X2 n=1 Tax=Chelonus insularis TaxID=460826 RepID=UPI001589445D|nr:oocyte zinc finger protein XlCOF6-like isoform X2 [Chelonus insularis]
MGSSVLVCPMCCGETFNNSQSLKYHLLSMTDNLYCPSCSQRSDSIAALIQHLDKCDENVANALQMDCNGYKDEHTEILMDTNVEEINESFLATVNHQEIMIVGEPRTIEVDENGEIKVVNSMDLNGKSIKFQSLNVKAENNGVQLNTNHSESEERDLDGTPVISIPESMSDNSDSRNMIALLADGTEEYLESDENLIEIKRHDNEIEDDELLKVKQELCETDSAAIYNCSSCGMSFNSVLDHIKEFHDGQEVVLEMVEDISDVSEPLQFEKEVPERVTRGKHRQTMNTLRTEECIDSEGRLYTRKVVQIERFWDKNALNTSHTTPKPASMIEKFFSNAEGVETQGKSQMTTKRYKCNQCLEEFGRLGEFRAHACLNGTNQCDRCDQAFTSAKALQTHLKLHDNNTSNGQKSFICKICGTEFISHKSLRLHSRMHAPVRARHVDAPEGKPTANFTCLECGKTLSESYREAHMALHTGDTVTCAVCNRKFDSADSLAMHAAVHPELGIQNSQSQNQIEIFVKPSSPSPTLPDPSSSFKIVNVTNSKNSSSVENDNGDALKPYQCQHCGRRFTRPHEKVKHERIHTGEKPHACEVCGKTFRVSYCLTLHMRTHTGVRPYQCQHCGKRFKASSVYNHHLLTHGDERAYTCPYCPKTFKTRVQLAGHKNSHTKPFRCTECSRPFASLYAARAHIQTHKKDNNLKFSCMICGASYGRAFALKDHLKVHDPDVLMPPEPAREEEVHEAFLLDEEEEVLEEELVNSGIQISIDEPE